jgi:hypothetical protein
VRFIDVCDALFVFVAVFLELKPDTGTVQSLDHRLLWRWLLALSQSFALTAEAASWWRANGRTRGGRQFVFVATIHLNSGRQNRWGSVEDVLEGTSALDR